MNLQSNTSMRVIVLERYIIKAGIDEEEGNEL
jgi:hypothetical protein